jgi:8-oxo-dGTP pyrophosphatase MutT (NUDIX family)
MSADRLSTLLSDPPRLVAAIAAALQSGLAATGASFITPTEEVATASAVLFLLARCGPGTGRAGEAGLILNKRSRRVRQPGDLCCPGGGVSRVDFPAGRLLALPFGPLGRWPHWRRWRRERPLEARWLSLYLATALREAFEEMRLNPLRAQFLGPLPPNRLQLFRKAIYPLAAWTPGRPAFRPNWEVERIVELPLRDLLDPAGYVCYHISRPAAGPDPDTVRRLPAFRLRGPTGTDILWGATYRIAMDFLKIVFGFEPPPVEGLPVVMGELARTYMTGEVK